MLFPHCLLEEAMLRIPRKAGKFKVFGKKELFVVVGWDALKGKISSISSDLRNLSTTERC
eukprot:6336734-Amphidinium_carterae.1